MQYKSICIFCGSAFGAEEVYSDKAVELAERLSQKGCNLVYGAGSQGLMGLFAKTMKEHGSYVVGITPKRFEAVNEQHPLAIDEYHVVENMHERKAMMYERSDAFIIFPGGVGTMDEMAEVMTWRQLGLHGKPIVIYNVNHYFDSFMSFVANMESSGFYKIKDYYLVTDDIDEIFRYLDEFEFKPGKYEALQGK